MAIALGLLVALAVLAGVWGWSWRKSLDARRQDFIRHYAFPRTALDKFHEQHPQFDGAQRRMVEKGLRDYFQIWRQSRFRAIGMPSQAVDDLWHAFILDTRAYSAFCQRAFGRFFHHVPAGAVGRSEQADRALVRTWRLGCIAEGQDPRKSLQLPLLFGMDAALALAGGQRHEAADFHERIRRKGEGGGSCGGGCAGGDNGCSGGSCSGGGCGGGGD